MARRMRRVAVPAGGFREIAILRLSSLGDIVLTTPVVHALHRAFPEARIDHEPDPVRARIVASWPQDLDDGRARADWAWKSEYEWDRAFDEYLLPRIKARYASRP